MGTNGSPRLFEHVPRWWSEAVVGTVVSFVTLGAVVTGSDAVLSVAAAQFGTEGAVSGTTVLPLSVWMATTLVLAVLYAVVGGGLPYAYVRYRRFDPGFVVERPDGDAIRLLAGLAVLGPLLVGAGTLALRMLGPATSGMTPEAYVPVATAGAGPGVSSGPLWLSAVATIALLALVGGPVAAAVFHGVLQNGLRKAAPPWVAAVVTVLASLLAVGATDPVDAVVLGAFVAATAWAYERTDNLVVPMVAYAVLNAVTLSLALALVLGAAGQL